MRAAQLATMSAEEGWVWRRRILYLVLAFIFVASVANSFRELSLKRIATSQTLKSSPRLLYPSVTACPWPYDPSNHNISSLGDLLYSLDHYYYPEGSDRPVALNVRSSLTF